MADTILRKSRKVSSLLICSAQMVSGAFMRRIKPRISAEEFKRRFPDGRSWRAAGCPQFGLERIEALLQELGYVPGLDFESGTDWETVWAFTAHNLPGQQLPTVPGPALDANDSE